MPDSPVPMPPDFDQLAHREAHQSAFLELLAYGRAAAACITQLLEDRAAVKLELDLISGALCDAGNVVVDPPSRGIAQLVAERNLSMQRIAALEVETGQLRAAVREWSKP